MPEMKSRFALGQRAYFQPNLRLIDARTGKTDPTVAAPCEVTAVSFSASKVFYDLDVIYVEEYNGSRIESRIKVARIPSDMIAEGAEG